MVTSFSIVFIILFLVIIGQLTYMTQLLRKLYKVAKLDEVIDPLFPAFPKTSVYRAKVDLLQAEEKHDDAFRNFSPGDKKAGEESAKAISDLDHATESFHRLIQGNIEVLNGKSVSKVIDEYRAWFRSQMFRT